MEKLYKNVQVILIVLLAIVCINGFFNSNEMLKGFINISAFVFILLLALFCLIYVKYKKDK
ncbi:hypothetical protein ACJ41M_13355 [Staphylococcus aureus]|uniref:hypothetical protein n=1 Tax=Staphylococcus aureus TaxID=1280 RepID=UPI0039BE0849